MTSTGDNGKDGEGDKAAVEIDNHSPCREAHVRWVSRKPPLPYFLPHIPSGVKPLSKARNQLRNNKSNRSTRHCPTASVGVRPRSPVFAFDCRDHVDERREAERVALVQERSRA